MRSALRSSEVFSCIIDHLAEDTHAKHRSDKDVDEAGRRALAVLARTCRAFSEPALDAVWRRLHNLRPLLLCLHGKAFENTYAEGAPLPPFDGEQWNIVSRYIPRVQELTLDDDFSVDILRSAWFRTTLLLPNLRSLRWSHGDYTELTLVRLLLSPSLVHLRFRVGTGNCTPVLAFLENYHTLCPNVRSLDFTYSLRPMLSLHVTTAISRAIARSPNLESLNCIIDEVALIHVAQSPCLKKLSSDLSQYEPDNLRRLAGHCAPDPDHPPFVNLRTLNLYVKDLSSVIPFFQSQHQPFEEVSFHFRIIATPKIFHEFFVALRSPTRCRTLRRIKLKNAYMTARGRSGTLMEPVNFQALSPLMAFNLHCFDIIIYNPILLNDDEFLQLVQSWPELESLGLYECRGRDDPDSYPTPTLRGLVLLLTRCPKLHNLGLSLDATDIPLLPKAESLIQNTVITRLKVGSGPIAEPVSAVVQFLLKKLPSLRSVVVNARNAKHMEYRRMWLEVDKQIREFSGYPSSGWYESDDDDDEWT